MSLELANANVVIVANQFNPSVVSQLWLVENGLASRDDFLPGCVFTEVIANVTTRDFGLFVVAPQLQFAPRGDQEGHQRIITERLGKLVELLPHTPYSAIGLNFTWHIIPRDKDTGKLSRSLFFRGDSPLFDAFNTSDARFGGYLSKDALGCRLKLDVKPITVTLKEDNKDENRIQFAFNFHADIGKDESASKQISAVLTKWGEANALAENLMKQLSNGAE